MSLENGRCPCCNGALILDDLKEKATCKYCGNEIFIQHAVQRYVVDGIATFDTLMLAAQMAFEYDKDYDKARKKYKEALNLKPNDYKVLWGLYICEVETLKKYKIEKGYVAVKGDLSENIALVTDRYGERAKGLAPSEIQVYYSRIIDENNNYFRPRGLFGLFRR